MESVKHLQQEVQRKLGRCMLRLQQYEMLLKTMVAGMAVEGPAGQLQHKRDENRANISSKTLGVLVGLFTGEHFSVTGAEGGAQSDDSACPDDGHETAWARIRFSISMSPERYAITKMGLAELVAMRNDLVHHFIERFDIFDEAGCTAAITYLDGCHTQIDVHFGDLKNWATSLSEVEILATKFMQSKAFEDLLVHGINPDGSVCWARSTIVECLRGAEAACQVDGWTALDTAIEVIQNRHRDHSPSRYGCKTWRQVVQKSGLFEFRSVAATDGLRGEAWYRSNPDGQASEL